MMTENVKLVDANDVESDYEANWPGSFPGRRIEIEAGRYINRFEYAHKEGNVRVFRYADSSPKAL